MSKPCAILTTTRNSIHIINSYLDSFEKFVSRERFDLYVYDNGSREGDIQILEEYFKRGRFDYFKKLGKNYLFTFAVNEFLRDIREKGYEQILVVNPDIEYTYKWDEFLDNNTGILGFLLVKPNGLIEHFGGVGNGDHIARGEKFIEGKYSEVVDRQWVTFGAVAIHKNVIEQCGEFDMNYPHFGSDREYCKKALENGFKIQCSPSKLIHGFGFSTRPYHFCDIPDDVYKLHREERKKSGVIFPEDQRLIQPYDQSIMAKRLMESWGY